MELDRTHELSDAVSRLQRLEHRGRNRARKPREKKDFADPRYQARIKGSTDWDAPVELVNRSITASDSAWQDPKSGKYIPIAAKKVRLIVYCDGTSDAVGLNYIEIKSSNQVRTVLGVYEEGSTSAPGGYNDVEIPITGGTFYYKAHIAPGRTSGSFDFVIQIVNYTR